MYKYRDAEGNMIVQGQPPPGFLNPRVEGEAEQAEAVAAEEAAPVRPQFVIEPPPPAEPPVQPWILAVLAALMLIGGLVLTLLQPVTRFLRESPLERVVRRSGYPAFQNVKLPRARSGDLTVEYVLHTPSGLLVLAAPEMSGVITGGPDLPSWSCGTKTEREQVPNPLLQVAANVEAVQQVVGNVPVFGRVVMTGKVSFPLKPPAEVQSLQTLQAKLPEFAALSTSERELGGAWRLLMSYPRTADTLKPVPGIGAAAWLRRNRVMVAGGTLLALGLVCTALAVAFS